jgi:hypothetical protein
LGEIIQFPEPEIVLTDEECIEFNKIKELLDKATTFREYRHLKKRINEFSKKVKERHAQNPLAE